MGQSPPQTTTTTTTDRKLDNSKKATHSRNMVTPARAQHQPLTARTELEHVAPARRARRADDGPVDEPAAHLAQRPGLAHGLLLGGARRRGEEMHRGMRPLMRVAVVVVGGGGGDDVFVADGQYRVTAAPRRYA